jgi:hypothetical protein
MALKGGGYKCGVVTPGDDVGGADFQPQGMWMCSVQATDREQTSETDGWAVTQGFATDDMRDTQNSVFGGALGSDDADYQARSQGFITYDRIINLCHASGSPISVGPGGTFSVYAHARLNSFPSGGASIFWEGAVDPPFRVGYLLLGCPCESGRMAYPGNFGGTELTQPTRIQATATMMFTKGVDPGSFSTEIFGGELIGGGLASFGFGALPPYGWVDPWNNPGGLLPEEFCWAAGEVSVGFGDVPEQTGFNYFKYWQGASWDHGREVFDGFASSRINIIGVTPIGNWIIGTNWRVNADRRPSGIGRIHIDPGSPE